MPGSSPSCFANELSAMNRSSRNFGAKTRLTDLIKEGSGLRPEKFRVSNGSKPDVVAKAILRGALIGALVALAGCRLDMHIQPRYDPLAATTFFGDGRAARPAVPGTVARGHQQDDELLYTGRINGNLADLFPFPITKADLERGQQRYNIYCTPCHDYTGSGNGMVVQRGFPAPPSYHIDRLMKAPAGHFFDVMTNGYGAMYSYRDRVAVKDRWRIAAYIRALQLSQSASVNDVPAEERLKLLGMAK